MDEKKSPSVEVLLLGAVAGILATLGVCALVDLLPFDETLKMIITLPIALAIGLNSRKIVTKIVS